MKLKTITKLSIIGLLASSTLMAGDGWRDYNKTYDSNNRSRNFSKWVDKNTIPKKYFGGGYSEGGPGITFGVNTDFGTMNQVDTNLYSMLEMNENRIEFMEGYDVMGNFGLRGFQVIPFLGISIDTSAADLGVFTGAKLRYSIVENWGVSAGMKFFLTKPSADETEDPSSDKTYFFSTVEYQY